MPLQLSIGRPDLCGLWVTVLCDGITRVAADGGVGIRTYGKAHLVVPLCTVSPQLSGAVTEPMMLPNDLVDLSLGSPL